VVLVVAGLLGGACAGDTQTGGTAQQAAASRTPSASWAPGAPRTSTSTTAALTTMPPAAAVPAAEPTPADAAVDDPVPAGHAVREVAATDGGPDPTGHLDIAAIGLSHDTYEGIELSSIDRGPSHWPGSALPGERGNTVFPGHRTTHSRPFYDIDRLRPGDQLVFTVPSGVYVYEVRESFVVDDEETWIVDPTPDPTFTIFACHPKGSARQRFVVKGVLVSAPAPPPPPGPPPSTTTTEPSRPLLPGLLP
jgi:sortase A